MNPFESLAEGAVAACVDIGGTKVAVTLATRRGFASRLVEPTATAGRNDAVARQVLRMIAGACASVGVSEDALGAVGIASTGPFVDNGGLVELASPNLCGARVGAGRQRLPNDWLTAPIVAWFEQAVQHAVCVEFERYIEDGDLAKTKERIDLLQRELEQTGGHVGMYL